MELAVNKTGGSLSPHFETGSFQGGGEVKSKPSVAVYLMFVLSIAEAPPHPKAEITKN